MSTMLVYLMKVILISGLLYSYYWFCLRNAAFHPYNRCYLLGITGVSLVLPFIELPVRDLATGGGPASPLWVLHEITTGHWGEAVTSQPASAGWRVLLTGPNPGYVIYGGVMLFFAVGLIRSLRYIRRLSRNYPRVQDTGELPLSLSCLEGWGNRERWDKVRFYLTDEPGTPFSFFRKIFWNRQLDLTSTRSQQILRHEWYHVRQRHTADILYLEVLRIVFWCNPFFHLICREIKATHEFLADRYATSGSDQYAYAELLVWQTIGHHPTLTNSFFNTHLKRRITMLTQSKTNRPGYVSRLLILPLLFLLFCAFAIRLSRKDVLNGSPLPSKALTVVIDAGHGGFDAGTISKSGINEKDLVLAIAKKIKQFSGAYHINVLMTREEDIMPGNKPTKEEGLRYRTQFADEHKADLFVSVHVNNAPDTARGMQVYLSSAANPLFQKSSMLGSVMIEAMKNIFATHQLLQREENIYVLQAAKMPAILIECGNMANPGDLSFITAEQNQEKVAKNILQGLSLYQQALAEPPSSEKSTTTKKDTRLMDIDQLILPPVQKKGC